MKKVFKTMAFTLLGLVLSMNLMAEKITTLAGITSGNKYYIGATTSSTDYYFYVDGSSKTESIKGDAKEGKADAVALTFTAVTDGWTIQFDNGLYLGIKNAKDNGAVQVMEDAVVWTIEENTDKGLLKLHPNDYYLQKNNSGAQFGSYKNTQTDVWLEAASSSKTLQSIAVSGTPTKTTYNEGEEFNPAGLTVTGTYTEGDPEVITSGIDWTITPNPLTAGTTSVSVTAKVGDITSAAYQVNGLTVKEFVQTYANTYTSNVTLSTEGGTSADAAKVVIGGKEYDALKAGTGKVAGACVITIPAATKMLHFHAAGWNGETVKLTINETEYALVADAGVSGNSPFTLQNDPETQDYFTLDPQGATSITFTATSGKRFVLFGVNFEADTKPAISADVEEIAFEQKELDVTATDSKVISATGKNLTAAISASMKSGSAAVFSVTPVGTPTAAAGEFTVSYSTTATGDYTGTVVLSSGETSLEIPVSASVVAHIPVLQSIYVSGEPSKKEYTVGDAFETAGLEVWGKYDEGEDQQITENIEWEVDPEKFETAGTVSVDVIAGVGTLTSEVYTVNNIKVNEAPKMIDNWNTLFGTSYNGQITGLSVNSLHLNGTTSFGVTVDVENHASTNGYIKDQDLRLYTNSNGDYTFTVTAPTGKIFKQIVATKANGGKDIAVKEKDEKGTISVDGTSGAMTWTGKANSLVFVPTATTGFGTMSFVIAEPTPSCADPVINPETEETPYWNPVKVTATCATENAKIYYSLDGNAPTTEFPADGITISGSNEKKTLKVVAKNDDLDDSQIVSKEFNFGPIFTSLEDLVAADLTSGTTVKVSFENVPIKKIDGKGVFFNIQKESKDIEIFYTSANAPTTWVEEGTLSGTMICPWKRYVKSSILQAWELAPEANSWNWSNLTYNAPAVTGLTKVEVEGTPDKTTYVDGEKFNPAGLTIYATIDNVRAEYDGSKGEVVYTITPETLTESTTSVSVVATIGTVSSEAYTVNGLTVNAIQESTIANFISNEGGRCYLIGDVSDFNNSTKRFNLTDATGTLYIYSHSLATGISEVADGEYIKVLAETYNTTYENAENVIVVEKPSVAVTGVSLDKENAEVQQGQSLTLVATIEPAGASNKNLTWSIINDNANGKISVDQDGKVTVGEEAVLEATATVQVETEDGHYTDACVITVKEYKAVKFGRYYGAITEGDYVITAIYQESEGAMNNSVSSSRLGITGVTPSEDYIVDPDAAIIWHITADEDSWTISNVNGYAAATGTKSQVQLQAVADKDSKAIWDITAKEDDVYDIESVYNRSLSTPVNSWLRRNQNTGWACYASSTGPSVKLYKKDFKAKAVLVSIAISGDLTKKDYFVDQKILPAGLTVTGTYSDGNHETITEGITWNIDPESFSEEIESGSVNIKATVDGKESNTITINDIVVTEKPNVHTYGYFDFTTNGPDIDFSTGWSSSYAEHVVTAEEATVTFESASKQGTTISNMPVSKGDDVVLHLTEEDKQIASVCLTTEQWGTNTHTITIEVSYDGTSYTKLTGVSGDETNGIQTNISDIAITYVKFKFSGTKQIGIESLTFTTADIPYVTMRDGQNLENDKMYSFCSPYDLICVKGAIFYQPDYMDAAYVHFVEAKEIKAGIGYILEGLGGELKAIQVGDPVSKAVEADEENTRGMQGVLKDDATYDIDGENEGYQFTETSYSQAVVSNNHLQYVGQGNVIVVGRAYLDLSIIATLNQMTEQARPGARRVAINFGGQTPTNLNGLNDNVKAAKVLRDGQLYIIRDTKTYNAQGIEIQ